MAIAGLRILVPVNDPQDPQRGALSYATALPAATGGELTLVRVSDPSATANLAATPAEGRGGRILVALDGSTSAEQALGPVVHLATLLPVELVLVRAVHAERDRPVAEDYLRHVASRLESLLDDKEVAWRVVVEFAATREPPLCARP